MAGNLVVVVAVALAMAALLLFGQFVYWALQARTERHAAELSRRLGTRTDKEELANALLRAAAPVETRGFGARLDSVIRQAGSPYTLGDLYGRIALAGTIGAVIGGAALRSPVGLLGALLGYVPVLLLTRAAEQRVLRLTSQLPDGLDLLARSLQAGHGLSEAMRGVAEEMPLPLSQEFGRVYEEHNLGRDFRDCMASLCTRNPSLFDLQIFVSSVLLQRETGGNLVEILQNISVTIRGRFLFHGKVRSLTSEARFTALILGGLPFFVIGVIAVLSPNYLDPLLDDRRGQMLVAACAAWFSVGVFTMRELSKVEL